MPANAPGYRILLQTTLLRSFKVNSLNSINIGQHTSLPHSGVYYKVNMLFDFAAKLTSYTAANTLAYHSTALMGMTQSLISLVVTQN